MRVLLFLFIALPITEIFVLIQVGKIIGGLSTIAIVILTAMIGLALLRRQGYEALQRAQVKMREGTLPAEEMVEGLFLAVGGALLLTPGFITDTLGFCCLLPGVRKVLISWGLQRFSQGQFRRYATRDGSAQPKHDAKQTIEGDFKRED